MLYSHLVVFFPGFVLLISSVTKRRNRSKHKINLLIRESRKTYLIKSEDSEIYLGDAGKRRFLRNRNVPGSASTMFVSYP